MEKLAIIDHNNHELIIEDVTDETLAKYGGEEEAYIKDTYPDLENYSWDYVTAVTYFPPDDEVGDYIEIDFEKLTK